MTEDALSILVVDDHHLVRAGITAAACELAANTSIFGAASILECMAILARHPNIDLVLLDLVLPDAFEFSGLDSILERYPEIPVILLTADTRRETMDEAFRKGASGYIPKSSNMQIIVNALRIILAGGRYLPGEMLDYNGLTRYSRHSPDCAIQETLSVLEANVHIGSGNKTTPPCVSYASCYGFTSRQKAVADLLRRGLSNKEICRELDLGLSTVKTHVASILRAMRTTSRTKASALLNKHDESGEINKDG